MNEELDTNIKVCCRFRPYNETELQRNETNNKIHIENSVIKVFKDDVPLNFFFDKVFGEQSLQEDVFSFGCSEMVSDLLKGYNCTIFAYGQTSSGKTFSLMGTPQNKGITPRIIEDIFQKLKVDNKVININVSYVEIYLEKIRDLLNISNTNLSIREGGYKEGIWIQDVTEEKVKNEKETLNIIKKGNQNRSVAETKMNERSSRSHSVFILNLEQSDVLTGVKTYSKLIIIDLAGSEKVSKTGATGLTLKQAQHTNRSLSTLGNVIRSICDKSPHIPYRDSKLTRILTDSLGGNSKTCLLITCSPALYNLEETISTLRFGSQVKTIKNKPKINEEKSLEEYKRLLEEAYKRIHALERGEKPITSQENKIIISDFLRFEKEKEYEVQKIRDEFIEQLEQKDNELEELSSSYDKQLQEKNVLIKGLKHEIVKLNRILGQTNSELTNINMKHSSVENNTEHLQRIIEHKTEMISVLEISLKKVEQERDTFERKIRELQLNI